MMDGKFRIGILQDDMTFRDSGEGPWDSYEDAEEFQKNEVGMRSEIIGGHDHVVTLKKVQTNLRFSRETLCFSADLVVDGQVVADIENTGSGGCHVYLWKDHDTRKLITAWALAQETDYPVEKLDQIVNKLVVAHMTAKKRKQKA